MALAAGVALLAIAIPVLAAAPSQSASPATASPEASAAPATASPSPSASPASSAAPTTSPTASPEASVAPAKPNPSAGPEVTAEPDKSPKPDKGPETTISLKGTVRKGVDGNGRPTFTMTVDGKTWNLSAGPPWFWGENNPLSAFAGKSVTVAGTMRQGDSEVDVETVDGKALRAPGKPPWAGGPWVVGPAHPGWKDWMAEGKPGNGHGRDGAPGQIKKASPTP